jgi:hypothetical protein
MATIAVFLPNLTGTAGMKLYLRKSSDFALINAGGDTLTESASSGWFTCTLTESFTERLSATVIDSAGLIPFAGWLPIGATQVVGECAVPDAATSASLAVSELYAKRNAVILSGLVTGAGTSTEVFAISALGITATITADSSGNRSVVTWT